MLVAGQHEVYRILTRFRKGERITALPGGFTSRDS